MTSHGVWHICDDFTRASTDADVVVAWSAFGDDDARHHSLPDLIRHHRDRYRSSLLDVFRQIESTVHGGRDTIDALSLRADLSYWWMTLVFAKRWGDLGVLPDAVKVLALADLLAKHRPRLVIIELSEDHARRSAIATAQTNGIAHETRGFATPPRSKPANLRALRTLITSCRVGHRKPATNDPETVIADYLFRLDPASLSNRSFRSQYWDDLPTLLPKRVLWLHRFVPHPSIPSRRRARRLLRGFNATDSGDRHVLLDDLHGLGEMRRALRIYRDIRALHKQVPDIAASFRTDRADLWPVFQHDWEESFRGSHAMSMAILATTLDSTVKMANNPRRLLYIFENQPWEAALLSAWRDQHDVPLIAVPHSTIRFWDLRYFVSVDTIGDPRFARADVIAANSPAAKASLIDGGWPGDLVAEVEALMYQYLGKPDTTCGRGNDIVVLGELDSASTQRYLRFLESALSDHGDQRTAVFKAHPLVDPATIDLGGLRVETTTEHLSTLLRRARVLVTGASGSTALESLSRGIPTVCVLDPGELDLSSIDRHPLMRLVGTATEFREVLAEFLDDPPQPTATEPMFHTDGALGRWRSLLGAVDSRK